MMRTLSTIARDVRHAIRLMVRRPAFTAVAVVTLAAGMAGPLVAFTAVNALFIKGLPGQDVTGAGNVRITGRGEQGEASLREFDALSRDVPSLEVSAQMPWPLSLRGPRGTEPVWAVIVAPGYFELLGMSPIAGRLFDASIDAPSVVVSERFWRARLGAAPLAGMTLNLSGLDVPVIGVMPDSPKGFGGFFDPTVWVRVADWQPLRLPERLRRPTERPLSIFGRLRGTATAANAEAELRMVASELARAWPDTSAGRSASFRPFSDGNAEMRAVAALAVLMLLCGVILGLLAAWKATARSQRDSRLRTLVASLQIAGATLLLTSAALLVRSAIVAASADVGFERERALVLDFDPSTHGEGAEVSRGFVDEV